MILNKDGSINRLEQHDIDMFNDYLRKHPVSPYLEPLPSVDSVLKGYKEALEKSNDTIT